MPTLVTRPAAKQIGPGFQCPEVDLRTLKERFRVYVDDQGTLRCDHTVRFLGLPVLHLHYRIERTDS